MISDKKIYLGLCVPIFILIGFIYNYAVDMPQMDEWEYVGIIDKYYSGNLTIKDLWAQHNEHRIFFPRILTLLNIIFLGWNVYVNMALTVMFAMCCAYLIVKMIDSTGMERSKKYWLIFSIMWIMFSFNQANNWLWGFQIAFALAVFASLLSIYILAMKQCMTRNTIMSALAAIVSIYSSANGLFVFPVGVLILCILARQQTKQIILWVILVGTAITCYFVNFHFIAAHGGFSYNLMMLISHPEQFFLGFGTILSRIVTKSEYVSFFVSFLALLWQVYLIVEYKKLNFDLNRVYIGLLGVGAYSLLCVLFIDFGRFTIGGLDAQRYIIFSLYFWVALLCQTYIILEKKNRLSYKFMLMVAMMSVVISVNGSLDAESYGRDTKMVLNEFKAQVVSGNPVDADFFTTWIYPDRNRIHGMEILKKNNIKNFQFANSEFKPEFIRIDKSEYIQGCKKCRWNVDRIKIDAKKIVEIQGWGYIIGENNQLNEYKLILKNDKGEYVSTLKNGNRADLIDAYPNEINLYHTGFIGWNKVYIGDVVPGDYDVFLGIKNPSGKYICPLDIKIHVP